MIAIMADVLRVGLGLIDGVEAMVRSFKARELCCLLIQRVILHVAAVIVDCQRPRGPQRSRLQSGFVVAQGNVIVVAVIMLTIVLATVMDRSSKASRVVMGPDRRPCMF
jgi:hypothetical protein